LFRRRQVLSGLTPELELQVKVSKMLGIAFAFSIVSLSGIGSLIALLLALRARSMIKNSQEPISGGLLLWWCIIAGALGTLTVPGTIMLFVKQMR
jgi:hypothetical protein